MILEPFMLKEVAVRKINPSLPHLWCHAVHMHAARTHTARTHAALNQPHCSGPRTGHECRKPAQCHTLLAAVMQGSPPTPAPKGWLHIRRGPPTLCRKSSGQRAAAQGGRVRPQAQEHTEGGHRPGTGGAQSRNRQSGQQIGPEGRKELENP